MHIYLTEKGHDFVDKKVIPMIELENKFMDNIPNEEFNIFAGLYTRYINEFKLHIKNSKN